MSVIDRIALCISGALIALLAPTHACGNDLLDAYRLALTTDAVLEAASGAHAADKEDSSRAWSQFLPHIEVNAGRFRERLSYQGTPPVNSNDPNIPPSDSPMQSFEGYSSEYGVRLSQTLWSFESYQRVKGANLRVAGSDAALRSVEQKLILRVSAAYFAILAATDHLATNRSERQAFATLLHQTKVREQTGVGPRSDVELAQSFLDATESQVIHAGNALEDAKQQLAEITGHYFDVIAPLINDIPLVPPSPGSSAEWVAWAREDNLDVQSARLYMEAARREVDAQRARGWPAVSLEASTASDRQRYVLGGDQDLDRVGIVVTWPLLSGGAVSSEARRAEANYIRARAEHDLVLRAAERRTLAAFRSVITGIDRINATRRAVDSAAKAVNASQHNVEFGTGSEFDHLNAQTNYYAALRAHRQSRYDYLTSLLDLHLQAGRLTEGDLASIDGLLVASAAADGSAPHVP